jgi:glutathione S-transferase
MAGWTLFASQRSPFGRKVKIALHELGLSERVNVVNVATNPMKPAPELLPYNPLGQVPTLVLDDGTVLVDSTAILDVLSELPSGGDLLPREGAARREVMQRLALADGMLDKAVRWLDERFQAQNDDTAERIAGFRAGIERTLDRLEAQTAAWQAGRFDAGDIALVCMLGYLDFRFAELPWRDGRSGLGAWFQRLSDRPSVVATAFSAS